MYLLFLLFYIIILNLSSIWYIHDFDIQVRFSETNVFLSHLWGMRYYLITLIILEHNNYFTSTYSSLSALLQVPSLDYPAKLLTVGDAGNIVLSSTCRTLYPLLYHKSTNHSMVMMKMQIWLLNK